MFSIIVPFRKERIGGRYPQQRLLSHKKGTQAADVREDTVIPIIPTVYSYQFGSSFCIPL
ncbi:MAG TPA: hypothetical protein P5191_13260 [Ruminococcus sp.]|nr:hypothetical protein [Ruminococcus sp.]